MHILWAVAAVCMTVTLCTSKWGCSGSRFGVCICVCTVLRHGRAGHGPHWTATAVPEHVFCVCVCVCVCARVLCVLR